MKKYLLIGLLVFLGVMVVFAPAGLIDRALEQTPALDMVDARGTVWMGQGQILSQGVTLGHLTWDFQPASLLSLSPTYAWQLNENTTRLSGTASSDGQIATITSLGQVDADYLNQWLSAYDIELTGVIDVDIETLELILDPSQLRDARGELAWSGGLVRYTLSGRLSEADLPPLTAYLQNESEGPQAVVYAQGNQTPLLFASQGAEGFIKIGITKMFTKLLNNPWPGSDPDHAIVLEVEQQLL